MAALACAGEFAKECRHTGTADFVLAYADWLGAHLEEWMVITKGELVEGLPRHYIRINPTDPHPDPNTTVVPVANGGSLQPARNIVGGDFLHLVRLGIRSPQDPIILDSIRVNDRVLKRELPQGPGWRRHNKDGYGQKEDGGAFDGTGVGRCWPILTGERGHYELAAGRDPQPFIEAMEKFSNRGGMISEELWDVDDLVPGRLKLGLPTSAAMPLGWSHAEYISLVRSRRGGVCVDRGEPAFQRTVANPVPSQHEFWCLRHPLRRMPHGKILRIILAGEADVVWTNDRWTQTHKANCVHEEELGLWSGESLFFDLALDDPSRAADLIGPIHERINGLDGWVTLEVSPLLAHDTPRTIAAPREPFAPAGVDIKALAVRLQDEGAKAFVNSWDDLMRVIESKSGALQRAV